MRISDWSSDVCSSDLAVVTMESVSRWPLGWMQSRGLFLWDRAFDASKCREMAREFGPPTLERKAISFSGAQAVPAFDFCHENYCERHSRYWRPSEQLDEPRSRHDIK